MMPVVDEHDHILGVITVDDVMDIIEEEKTLKISTVTGADQRGRSRRQPD